ncbi:glycoside hydrolase family 18 protein [Backusella circina FSU 941]|nr:glycoside hydrolase family 18 protein [Backusella circina FSU 941]
MIKYLVLLFVFVLTLIYVEAKEIYGEHRLIAYVVDWDIPKHIPWGKLDHIAYAFAVPDEHGNLVEFDKEQLREVTKEAHQHGKGVSLAVGGWTGSVFFSRILRTEDSRERFADKLVEMVDEYNLNGINLDWEYPNDPSGVTCNEKNPQDTENLLSFVKQLREQLQQKFPDEHKLITAAVSTNVFKDEDQNNTEQLDGEWNEYMDGIYVMAYDLSGIYSETALPNSALYGEKTSAEKAIDDWKEAGISPDLLFLGLPFYGYTHKTARKRFEGLGTPLDRRSQQIRGDVHDTLERDPCPGAKSAFSGEYQWRSMRRDGSALGESGWSSFWDDDSQTPFSFHQKKRQFVTYENPKSLSLKADYAKDQGLGGVMLWSLEMDDEDDSLLDAIQQVRD